MPSIGQLEAALPTVRGSGERALLVAEDLAFEQRLGNGRAVDGDERKRRARTQLMDGLGDQFLARARFAGDEHRRARRRRLLDDRVDLPHLRAVADHRAEGAVLAQLAAQRLHFAQRLEPLDDLVEQDLEPLEIHRLGEVVVGAFLHRLDGGFDGALRREQQGGHVRALRLERAQQPESVQPRHHEVGDDDRRPERGDLLERLFPVAGRFREESPAANELFETDAGGGVVLDD